MATRYFVSASGSSSSENGDIKRGITSTLTSPATPTPTSTPGPAQAVEAAAAATTATATVGASPFEPPVAADMEATGKRKGHFAAVTGNNGTAAATASPMTSNSSANMESIDIDVCNDDGDDDVFFMESSIGYCDTTGDSFAFNNGTSKQHHHNHQSQAPINCVNDLNAQLTRFTSNNNNSQESSPSIFNSPLMCSNFSLSPDDANNQPLTCFDDSFIDSSLMCQESSRQSSSPQFAFSGTEDDSLNSNSNCNSLTELHSKPTLSPPPSPLSMCLLIRNQPQTPTSRILRRRCLFARKKKKQRHHRSPSPKSVPISPTYSTCTDEELTTDTDTDTDLPVIARETLVNLTQEKMRSCLTDVHANSSGLRNRVLIESAFKKFLVSELTLTPKKRTNDHHSSSPTGASSVPSSPRKRSISSSSCSDLPSLSDNNSSSQSISFAFSSSTSADSHNSATFGDSLSDSIKRIRLIHSESDSDTQNNGSNGIKQSQSLSCSMNNLASVFCQVHRITDAAQEDPQFMVNTSQS